MMRKAVRAYLTRLASKGGAARAKSLTPEQRTAIARKGGKARQAKGGTK